MQLVHVCNVGEICGGTAACVWTITRALPECQHVVLCLGRPSPRTVQTFAPVEIRHVNFVDDDLLAPLAPDLVLLHNSPPHRIGKISICPRMQYLHSAGKHAPADMTLACSQWLAEQQSPPPPVLYQPVPVPRRCHRSGQCFTVRHFDDDLTIGRICTPQLRKWPESCLDFYHQLADQFSSVRWDFVGCPQPLQAALQSACGGRARFYEAGWEARSRLWRWHAMLYHHPSLTESFGRTAAEAMRAGCIPILDNRGGFREQILNEKTGFLCDRIEEFAAAITSISESDQRWKISRSAQQSAEERFSLRTFARQFRKTLSQF